MARNTEPKLTAPDNMQEPERASLALFLDTVKVHAATTAGVIKSYDSPTDLMLAAELSRDSDTLGDKILQAAAPLFAAEIDLDVDVDSDTALAMRRGIDKAAREGADMERRRILRMAIFAGEVATWQENAEMMAHINDEGPTATSQGTAAAYPPRQELVLTFIDNPLPETA